MGWWRGQSQQVQHFLGNLLLGVAVIIAGLVLLSALWAQRPPDIDLPLGRPYRTAPRPTATTSTTPFGPDDEGGEIAER